MKRCLNQLRLLSYSAIHLALFLIFCPTQVSALPFLLQKDPEQAIQELLSEEWTLSQDYRLNLDELKTFYLLRQNKPAWNTQDSRKNHDLENFVTTVNIFALYHGLDSKAPPTALMRKLIQSNDDEDHVRLEILITDWLIKIAHALNGDNVDLSQLYVGWAFKKEPRSIVPELELAINNDTIQRYFDSLAPQDLSYWQLADTLKIYRKIQETGGWPMIPTGPTLRLGDQDSRVPLLHKRLIAEGYDVPDNTGDNSHNYSAALHIAVSEYQLRHGLDVDGNIGPKTLAAINRPVKRRIDQIRANMERLRHMPREMPETYALVNIAEASIKLMERNKELYHAPVVVGRPDRRTPFVQSEIRSIIFNPSWHVPDSIARKDILPKLRKDPHYLEKLGFVIKSSDRYDPSGKLINWKAIKASEFNLRLRQAPGEMNALGHIKFDFDNDFSVYLHGTPHHELFAKADRHLSSGCIRLKDPEEFAVFVLKSNENEWDREAVEEEVAKRKTHWQEVTEPLPLYLVYQTAFFPTTDSPIYMIEDVYNYDTPLIKALAEEE